MNHSFADCGERLVVYVPNGYKATISLTPEFAPVSSSEDSYMSLSSRAPAPPQAPPSPRRDEPAADHASSEYPDCRHLLSIPQEQSQVLKTRSFKFSNQELLAVQAAILGGTRYLEIWNAKFKHIQRETFKYRYQCIAKDLAKLV